MTFEHSEYWYNLKFLKKDLRIKMLVHAKEIFFFLFVGKNYEGLFKFSRDFVCGRLTLFLYDFKARTGNTFSKFSVNSALELSKFQN